MRTTAGRTLSSVEARRAQMLDSIKRAAEEATTRDGSALTTMIADIVILVVNEVKASNGL